MCRLMEWMLCVQAAGMFVIWRTARAWLSWVGSWLCWRFSSCPCWSLSWVDLCSGTVISTPPSVCTGLLPSARWFSFTRWPRTFIMGWVNPSSHLFLISLWSCCLTTSHRKMSGLWRSAAFSECGVFSWWCHMTLESFMMTCHVSLLYSTWCCVCVEYTLLYSWSTY